MNIDVLKTSQNEGAVFFKYKLSRVSPDYTVTLPFQCDNDGLLKFKITEEALRDIIELIKSNFDK